MEEDETKEALGIANICIHSLLQPKTTALSLLHVPLSSFNAEELRLLEEKSLA